MAIRCSIYKIVKILVFYIIPKLFAVNVALRGLARFTCGPGSYRTSTVTDGDKNLKHFKAVVNSCNSTTIWIEIKLFEINVINYVMVYSQSCLTTGLENLDYFNVDLFDTKTGIYTTCGKYHNKCSPSGMRVNCKDMFLSCDGVKIETIPILKDAYVNIVEIEAHSIAKNSNAYLGCLVASSSMVKKLSLVDCKKHCHENRMYFALIQKKRGTCDCFCSKTIDIIENSTSFDECNYTCGIDHYSCGGPAGAFSVYAAVFPLPTSDGCTRRNMSSSRRPTVLDIGISECIDVCKKTHNASAYMKVKCHCYSSRDMEIMDSKSCNETCIDNKEFLCGSQPSFYSVYTARNIRLSSLLYKCHNDSKTPFGNCEYGCKAGWTGELCHIKVTASRTTSTIRLSPSKTAKCIPGTCDNISTCVETRISFKCVCMEGYSKNATNFCGDIDECQFKPCFSEFSTCINTIGSYGCQCLPGYYELDKFLCQKNITEWEDLNIQRMRSSSFLITLIIGFSSSLIVVCLWLMKSSRTTRWSIGNVSSMTND